MRSHKIYRLLQSCRSYEVYIYICYVEKKHIITNKYIYTLYSYDDFVKACKFCEIS